MDVEQIRARVVRIIEGYDGLGVHRTGTAVDEAGVVWFIERLADVGVTATADEFEVERLDVVDAHIEVSGRRIDAVPLFDGGSTEARGVGGTLVDLAAPATDATPGTIGSTEVGTNPHAELASIRRATTHAGIVVVPSPDSPCPGLSLLNAPDYTAPFGPPVVQVSNEHAADLRDALGSECTLTAQTRHTPVTVSNVVATVTGADPAAAPLAVMTPRSSWWQSTGERGGGIAVFLEIARAVAATRCRRTVHFVGSTGHELGHLGLEHHLRARPGLAAGAHAWIHLGANFGSAMRTHLIAQASDPEFEHLLSNAMATVEVVPTMVVAGTDRPLGEAENIFDAGGRYVSLVGGQELFHHEDDRWPANVDLDITARLARAMSELAVQLGGL